MKDVIIQLARKDAGYNREKTVAVSHYYCDKCEAKTRVLTCDSSEGEYGPVYLCLPCIQTALEET
jgi:hypothetical protein